MTEHGNIIRTSQHGPDVIRIECACVDKLLYLVCGTYFPVLHPKLYRLSSGFSSKVQGSHMC